MGAQNAAETVSACCGDSLKPSHRVASLLISLLALVAVPGCHAAVDRDHYAAGEEGVSVFTNDSQIPAWLAGCSPFNFEQRIDGQWEDRGPPFVCVWEGIAVPVAPGERVESRFSAPGRSGLWRLHYPVGLNCEADLPQSACEDIFSVRTKPFTVEREPCPPETFECRFVPAAPNYLCPDGEHIGGPSGVCTRDPESGVCGYEFLVCP
jgi:uncharacterized protein YndB with AHSA1/START domain